MTWPKWVIFALLAWGTLNSIKQIGKPRRPLTPEVIVIVVVLNGLFALLVYLA